MPTTAPADAAVTPLVASPIPQWVIGKKVTAFSLTPQTVGTGGALTDGTAASLVGLWDEVDVELETETEEISAADALRHNTVILKDLWRIRMVEILSTTTGNNKLAGAWTGATNEIFKMILTRGPNTWTLYVARTGYTENVRKGRTVGIFTGAIVDAGAAGYA